MLHHQHCRQYNSQNHLVRAIKINLEKCKVNNYTDIPYKNKHRNKYYYIKYIIYLYKMYYINL